MSPALSRFLAFLRCPIDGQPLETLAEAKRDEFNRQLASGLWCHADGSPILQPLVEAFATPSGNRLYRIDEDIAWLLPTLAIERRSELTEASHLRSEKEAVQSFYDDFGWVKNEAGLFGDTAQFTDPRTVSRDYQRRCNARIGKHLGKGRAILDAASGPIPHPEYLNFSEHYDVRVCVDFSVRALKEAKAKLGERGIYILGDITRLPFAEGSMDAVISLHTVYHVPADEQASALAELYRVVRPGGVAVVVYIWKSSLLVAAIGRTRTLLMTPKRSLGALRGRKRSASNNATEGAPNLFFNPLEYSWYASKLAPVLPVELRVWSAITTEFQLRFFSENARGRMLARLVGWAEDCFPSLLGRFGQYPMFVMRKPERE